ncbi:S-formylglutathione hydrolase FrmB [Glycomyces sambucus]|uniref:S-formylglutathione hydrolase FrmB n=1 Tax=Glycomyces sambucus TaxID=380244 RepID=A0A1G9G4G9_9ACTN|nr:alpha/beta hydrolase family protein [Glycomyces sambucus]SDK95608.1 S-formylglutathione hydrolase FrmB [Glycomyces sambucus]
MAMIRYDYRSEVLELSTSLTACVPDEAPPAEGYPVLFLLHGLSDDATMWARKTALERHLQACALPMLVVMPQAHRSYYTDEAHGIDHWTHVTTEVPAVVARTFRASAERRDTYVAGLSMGGYGAVKWALREPERFGAAASFSGALGLAQRTVDPLAAGALDGRLWDTVFDGRDVTGTEHDLLRLLESAPRAALPPLRVSCGTDDPLLAENERFIASARGLGIDLAVDIGPGAHTWDYWDAQLQAFLAWLPAAAGSGLANA